MLGCVRARVRAGASLVRFISAYGPLLGRVVVSTLAIASLLLYHVVGLIELDLLGAGLPSLLQQSRVYIAVWLPLPASLPAPGRRQCNSSKTRRALPHNGIRGGKHPNRYVAIAAVRRHRGITHFPECCQLQQNLPLARTRAHARRYPAIPPLFLPTTLHCITPGRRCCRTTWELFWRIILTEGKV